MKAKFINVRKDGHIMYFPIEKDEHTGEIIVRDYVMRCPRLKSPFCFPEVGRFEDLSQARTEIRKKFG